jgi:hypothetical protein
MEFEEYKPHGAYAGPWGGRWVAGPEGSTLVINWLSHSGENDPVSVSIHRYEVYKEARLVDQELEHFELRSYPKEELITLLKECGYEKIAILPSYSSRPQEDLIIEAWKPVSF